MTFCKYYLSIISSQLYRCSLCTFILTHLSHLENLQYKLSDHWSWSLLWIEQAAGTKYMPLNRAVGCSEDIFPYELYVVPRMLFNRMIENRKKNISDQILRLKIRQDEPRLPDISNEESGRLLKWKWRYTEAGWIFDCKDFVLKWILLFEKKQWSVRWWPRIWISVDEQWLWYQDSKILLGNDERNTPRNMSAEN